MYLRKNFGERTHTAVVGAFHDWAGGIDAPFPEINRNHRGVVQREQNNAQYNE